MLTKKELIELREELVSSKKLLVFFDGDADGCSSFLLYYRFAKNYAEDLKGIIVSPSELKDEVFVDIAKNYEPDKIFILDKPMVSQDFIDSVKRPMIWLDHHPLQKRSGIRYYNPLKHPSKGFQNGKPDSRPTTYWAYKTIENDRPQDLWIAMTGCISDWFVPEFYKEFSEKYPDLLPKKLKIKNPGDVLYGSKLGILCKVVNFILKYPANEAMTSVKILSRIEDPREILNQSTPAGKYLYKQYAEVNRYYEEIRSSVKVDKKNKLLLVIYEGKYSIGADLSTDLKYHNPKKIVLIAKIKNGNYVCSFRSEVYDVRSILEKALVGIDGYGGGHRFACGGSIKVDNWEKFLDNFKNELKKAKMVADK
ncbi:MAG TPA: DHH family phosphoesterase [Alphaproteobacteria bacterium]|nr:DHH family phosphoesterase [Alphaproteobacteria bacterium]